MGSAMPAGRRRATEWWGGALLLTLTALALAAPLIAPQDPSDPLGFDPLAANHPPSLSWTYLLGADARGRSVLALLLWGGRVTLAIGAGAALLAAALGLLLGALCLWRRGLLDPAIARLMELCQAAPPLLILLLLAARLGGVPTAPMLAVFALTGWIGPARLTRAMLVAGWRAPYIDAARAVGVTGPRLLVVHLLPAVAAPLAAWVAGAAATYMALEAGLDFLGLGLPSPTTSWGNALVGAQDALASGNWWWLCCGGAALALTTLALGALARGIARAVESTAPGRRAATLPESPVTDEPAPALGDAWRAWQPRTRVIPKRRSRGWGGAIIVVVALLLVGAAAGASTAHRPARPLPSARTLLQEALDYPHRTGQPSAYIATVVYTAAQGLLRGRQIPWAAWTPCPGDPAARCARSEAQLWYSDGRARAQMEGVTAICTPRTTWVLNPMAGAAETEARPCGATGPDLGTLGTTAGIVAALLPTLRARLPRVLGADVAAGRRCWVVALSATGRLCVDAATGLALRMERLDHAGQSVASFTVTALSFGLDLAPQLFTNPIPGGHGPLISGLTQPLLDIQAADDMALFITLVPGWLPAGLTAQTPTFDSFYDATRGYAPQQRVRQAYTDRAGRVALVLIETLAGSAWDVTPPARGRRVVYAGQRLVVWPARGAQPALVRREADGTAALLASRVLSLSALERAAAGLQ